MLDKIKSAGNVVWGVVVAIVGLLLLFLNKRRKDAEAALENAHVEKEEAVAEEKHQQIEKSIEDVKKQGEEEKKKTLSREEMQKFLNDL